MHNLKIENYVSFGVPQWLSSKESACKAGDAGSIPGSGRSPGGGRGNPLQHSCLENPRDGGDWWPTVHRVAESQRRLKRLSTHADRISPGKAPCGSKTFLERQEQLLPLYLSSGASGLLRAHMEWLLFHMTILQISEDSCLEKTASSESRWPPHRKSELLKWIRERSARPASPECPRHH